MRIFDKYLVREFLKPVAGSIVLIVGILLVSRVMDDMGWTLSAGQPLKLALRYWFFHIPEYIAWVLPMAMLFATSFTIGNFNRFNELVALMVGGVSFFRITLPMLIIGFILSIVSFFLNDTIVVYGNQQRDLYQCYIDKWPDLNWCDAEFSRSNDRNNIKVRSPKNDDEIFFVAARKLIYANRELMDVDIVFRKKNVVKYRLLAAKARFEDDRWYFFNGIQVNLDASGTVNSQIEFQKEFFPVYLPFQRLMIVPRKINIKIVRGNSMSMADTGAYVRELKAAGKPYLFEKVEYYSKLSVPFMAFILTLIGTATGTRMKKAVVAMAFAQSLLIAFFYVLLLQLGRVLGREGILAPFVAAWLGNIVFFILGLYFFKKSNL